MRILLPTLMLVFLLAGQAVGGAAEKSAMFAVRLTTEATVLNGCDRTGRVSDSSLEDLRKKIVRSGGNAALLVFDSDNLEKVHAEVYRCAVLPK
jgi:hypothetical protein